MYQLSDEVWIISRSDITNNSLTKLEPLFSLSNGSFGVRGTLAEMPCGNMMGTYLGGVFDKSDSYTPDMVNLPCFLKLDIVTEKERFGVDDCKILEHSQKLDMKKGLVFRSTQLKTPSGKILTWTSYRLVSIVRPYIFVEKHILLPENFSGKLSITHHLDANTMTIDTWKDMYVNHYEVQELEADKNHFLYATVKLNDSRHPVTVATGMDIQSNSTVHRDISKNVISVVYVCEVYQGKEFIFDRFSSAQSFMQNPDQEKLQSLVLDYANQQKKAGFDVIKKEHERAMVNFWNNTDIIIGGDPELQKNLRFNIFELIAGGPRHNEKISIGARGLTGEQYRGHVFWDTDLFMLPFYIYQDPTVARNMLMYRYHTLDGARRFSASNYTHGARFSVQTADTGDDASPVYDVDSPHAPIRVGKTGESFRGRLRVPWLTREEIHINGCVAYGIWSYYKATLDKKFILNYGLEILIEIARYWCSRMEWVKRNNRYELLKTVGGDEFHFHAKNNAFTNYLAWFSIDWAIKLYRMFCKTDSESVRRLEDKIGICEEEIAEFEKKQSKFYLPQPNDDGIIEQQDGWLKLKPFKKVIMDSGASMSIMRTTGIQPNSDGGEICIRGIFAANDWQIVKQCDLVILFWLFPDLFEREIVIKNYDYYEDRTIHMSSLSPNTSSIVAARFKGSDADLDAAYHNLLTSSQVDLCDYQFNAEWGLHYASIGGTWNSMIFGFGGLCVTKDMEIELYPKLYKKWNSLRYKFWWHNSQADVYFDGKRVILKLLKGEPFEVKIFGTKHLLKNEMNIEMGV